MPAISPIRVFDYPSAEAFNAAAARAMAALGPEDFRERSHFIAGRFENLYLDPARIPGLEALLDYALEQAAAQLERPLQQLRRGFWLNRMAPGQVTSRHAHAEHDELLSGVYYIQVPAHSGDLLFDDDPFEIRIRPRAGMGVLFDPELTHWVEEHRGAGERLSVAFNIGPVQE
ncbi:putative 2OG-Fe(II) oxygenase [Rhabdochromatium marinum]|uniref:putative 2OG-Fe(II) oxygenase n=1 Tax=Rhabdochromatium marinum TaxID=48729 RepID=UPI00190374B8|nr:putative 2OG-Fe(II) oxygenase [Rhabdochromatium marinum]MBK1647718.1 hypothetical protein [Rhabdochromatium marinum]